MKKFNITELQKNKLKGIKTTMLTAYDYSTAKLFDKQGIDIILVGDSLGMVMLGHKNTLNVTMNDMIHHSRAVGRAVKRAMVLTDMPFLSYHISPKEAVRNAGRLIQEGKAEAIKIEGCRNIIKTMKKIVSAQIPIFGHLGLTPQSILPLGGYKVQGKTDSSARLIVEDALRIQEAGACALVLECIPSHLSELITDKLEIPTLGIGAGVSCDGQVLVYQDMLNMYDSIKPKFVKVFADVGENIKTGVKEYISSVKNGSFPSDQHSFTLSNKQTNES